MESKAVPETFFFSLCESGDYFFNREGFDRFEVFWLAWLRAVTPATSFVTIGFDMAAVARSLLELFDIYLIER